MLLFLQLSCLFFAARAASSSSSDAATVGGSSPAVLSSDAAGGRSSHPAAPRQAPLLPPQVETAGAVVRPRRSTGVATTGATPPLLLSSRTTAVPQEAGWVKMADGKWAKSLKPVKDDQLHYLAACHIPLPVRRCVEAFLARPENVADAWRVGMEELRFRVRPMCSELVPGMDLEADGEFADATVTYGKAVPGSLIYRPAGSGSAGSTGKGKGGGKAGKGGMLGVALGGGKGKKGGGKLFYPHSVFIREEDIQAPARLLTADPIAIRLYDDQAGLWYDQLPAFSHEGYLWCPRKKCGCGIRFTPDGVNRFRKHLATCRADVVESFVSEEDRETLKKSFAPVAAQLAHIFACNGESSRTDDEQRI